MEKVLRLYYKDGGVIDAPFPNLDNQIEIGAFRYDAKRMGGAPTITASVMYPQCLDSKWTDSVYAEFNGEKYYLKQTPTSSYSNEDERYKHDLELVSERRILDDVYFFDVVTGDPMDSDKPVSNSTKVVFFGNVREFVARLNASLAYSHIDYEVVVDDEVETEEKLMSFEDQFFSNVLQEIYNTYEEPYYFDGKTIHIGKSMPLEEGEDLPTFSYGVDNALLSITKNNANYKIVNRVTGTGSSENIPFYYPNNSPKGNIEAVASNNFEVNVVNYDRYSNEVELNGIIRKSNIDYQNLVATHKGESIFSGKQFESSPMNGSYSCVFAYTFDAQDAGEMSLTFNPNPIGFRDFNAEVDTNAVIDSRWRCMLLRAGANPERPHGSDILFIEGGFNKGERKVKIDVEEAGQGYIIAVDVQYVPKREYENTWGYVVYSPTYSLGSESGWVDESGKAVKLASIGLSVDGRAEVGDTITQRLVKYVKTSQNLMPSIYRETDGDERFYNAINGEDGYKDESGNDIVFNNPYAEGRPKEHIITVEDIKPTITGTEVNGLRIDMFSEFAYDRDDNDETYEDEEGNVYFKHPYFYGKLRVMDFNLFDHAIENQPMTISFTSGDCGACNFEIGVTEEYPQKNPVQVDANGILLRDANGMVLAGVEGTQQDVTTFQERQQDTSKYEVWIALKKEEETYGILMPQGLHKPKAARNEDGTLNNKGDTFVILGINLPQSYIINAEKKLEAEIIKYLKENNDEKFTFSIGFSRIFFEENDILEQLSENSRIRIIYDSKPYDLYVSSFSYSMSEGDVLPEIRVELDETLKVSQNALQNAISQVKSELGKAINSIDVVGAASPYFIRKDEDDEVRGRINFKKGIKFGEGGKVEVMDNNSAKLTIEYLEVTKKASFTSLEIQEKTHVGGQILVTPAAINCGEVEELEAAYRCYFQTKGTDGDEIFNQFAVGDQAICQTYNAWGSKYYWRLVTGVGEDYIDLSKTECDEESGIPQAGDKIIQLGNQVDTTRQNAIVIAAYGDGSPYIIQYKGINSFEIGDDKIVTKLSSTENIFTGKVHMEMGSDGLENLGGGFNIGGQNLLRNSGFTGDYLSEPLADEQVLDATKQLFSDPLDHWDVDGEVEVVELVGVAVSGKGVKVSSGKLFQETYYRAIYGEKYILSFKANATSDNATISATWGGSTQSQAIPTGWDKYVMVFTATTPIPAFTIDVVGEVTLCDIQLERGTMATAWGNSWLDNSSDRAYYQSIKYISDSVVNEAMTEGATDVLGGLILTNHIKVGEYANGTMIAETGGISGKRIDEKSVAFWAGGDFTSAIYAVDKLKDNPTYQPTEEELASMAKFVVTHGGRSILNDIILRGYVYAKGGTFGDLKIGKYVNACGKTDAEDSVFTERAHSVGNVNYKTTVQMASGSIRAFGTHHDGQSCYFGNAFEVDADSDANENSQGAVVRINATTVDAMLIEDGDIVQKNGCYRGFRPQMMVITDNANLGVFDSGITIVADTTNTSIYLNLEGARYGGSNFEIHKIGNGTLVIEDAPTIIYYKGQLYSQYTINDECCIKIIYSAQTEKWYMVIV